MFWWTANLAARIARFNRTSRGRIHPQRIEKTRGISREFEIMFIKIFRIEPWYHEKTLPWFQNSWRESLKRYLSFQHLQQTSILRSACGHVFLCCVPMAVQSLISTCRWRSFVDWVMLEKWASPAGWWWWDPMPPPPKKGPYWGKPMVNSPLIRPAISWGGWHWGGRDP